MSQPRPPRPDRRVRLPLPVSPAARRGVLLLMVLSMLTLFLMIGILLLVMTTRTRATARAFSEGTNTTSHGALSQRTLLDEALMRLIRGPSNALMPESILEDKYGGDFLIGQLTGYSDADKPLIQATISGVPTTNPLGLGGRIVTFRPRADDDGMVSSYRIVRVFSGTQRFLLANLRPDTPAAMPSLSRLPCEAVINGREFTITQQNGKNEPYDAHGNTDPWLTKLTLSNSEVTAAQPAFDGGDGQPVVDNDNDGVADGVWLEGLFPDSTAADGGTLRHSVSYLVVDLDGRLNVNAHGGLSPQVYPDAAWSPQLESPAIITGLGAGPAGVDASILAPYVLQKEASTEYYTLEPAAWSYGRVTNRWHRLLAGSLRSDDPNEPLRPQHPFLPVGSADPLIQRDLLATRPETDVATLAKPDQRRPRQFLGDIALAGRYGEDGLPGAHPGGGAFPLRVFGEAGTWLSKQTVDQFQQRSDQSKSLRIGDERNVETWRIAGNSPVDLHGRLRPVTPAASNSPVPRLVFDAPSWSNIPAAEVVKREDEIRARGFDPTDFYGPIKTPGFYGEYPPVPPLTYDYEYTVHDLVNDPYEAELGSDAAAPSLARSLQQPDAIYTVAELEAILRPFDADTQQLPARLTSIFDDLAQRHRTTITTDSWDTPGLVGGAAFKVTRAAQSWNLGDTIYAVSSPDIASGLRFDLNRPGIFRIVTVCVRKTDTDAPSQGLGLTGGEVVQYINQDPNWVLSQTNPAGELDCFGQTILGLLKQQKPPSQDWFATTARRLPSSFSPAALRETHDLYHVTMERPVARQQYFSHLYHLLWMLYATDDSGNPRPLTKTQKLEVAPWLAQWAANVIEFRDPDSTMSRYQFDPDPTDGVGNDPAQTVFGCERPEVVITETLAYDYPTTPAVFPAGKGLLISLYRPWSAAIQHEGTALATERIDPILAPNVLADDPLANSLHLGKKEAGTGASIWRLRVKRVRPDGTPEPDEKIELGAYESNPAAAIGPNSQVIIGTGPAAQLSIGTNPIGVTGVYLERLANPNRGHPQADEDRPDELNPYIAVDYAPIVVNREPPADEGASARVRHQGFWRSQFEAENRPIANLLPDIPPQQRGSYYHWPNRDFIGHAELMLVPMADGTRPNEPPLFRASFKALEAHESGGGPSLAPRAPAGNVTALTVPQILDATIVPSRFMGTSVTVGNPTVLLKDTPWATVPCNQLSRWREPGRINLNTVANNPQNIPSQQGQRRPRRSLVEDLTTGGTLVRPQLPEPFGTEPIPAPPRSIDNAVRQAIMNPSIADGPWTSISELLRATASMPANAGLNNADALRLSPAIRLSNVATVRSHVFAVWVTVKTENTMTGDSRTRRVFAIVDRSIPVGYWPGVDLNAADTIRLKRFLE